MSFLNPAMLAGLGLAAIPVLLHLLLRAKPKRLVFPALRLIQQRRRSNVRRIQLRHLWLLFLRIAVIALIVLALCRPSLPAANYSLSRFETVMLVVILMIALGAYFGVMEWWRRQKPPKHILLTRRTMLRGGVGIGTVLLALLAVVWPYARRVSAEIKDPTPHVAENVPVAAVFLFDTSPSMWYKQANKSRLKAGQEIAKVHLGHLPAGSKVAVANSTEIAAAFSGDLIAAQSRIDAQEIKSTSLMLSDRLRTILVMQEDDRRRVTSEQSSIPESNRQDRFVREVYVFTDLSKSAWRENDVTLRQELDRLKGIGVYLIDVGETDPTNVSVSDLKLSRESAPDGGTVRVTAKVSLIGPPRPDQIVELYLKGEEGWSKSAFESLKLERDSEAGVTFPIEVKFGKERFVQGELRLAGSDPLSIDDIASFTIQGIPPLKVLIVAEKREISEIWTSVLNGLNSAGKSAYETELATPEQLTDQKLAKIDIVCLINASRPSAQAWKSLHDFVERGGGLAVFLGASSSALSGGKSLEQIDPVAYQNAAAMSVLPAKPIASLPHRPASSMDLRSKKHTLLARIDDYGALLELGAADVRRYWKVEPSPDSSVIAKYLGKPDDEENGAPALIERLVGQGRVVMMTTGVDGVAWNDFLADEFRLGYVVFADQLTQYLSWQSSGVFNHVVGDDVRLSLDKDRKLKKVVLRLPDFKQRAVDIPADSANLVLRDLTAIGSYAVDSADRDIEYHAGFSMNLLAKESHLSRLTKEDLDTMLGEGRYSVNRDPGSLERNVNRGRLGQEMYGMVVAFLVAAFAMEQFTATWFYRGDDS